MLAIRDLKVSVDGKEILLGVSLAVKPGEIVALMGPNGSGKSTLAYTLMGHPRYRVTSGSATFASDSQAPKTEVKPRFSERAGVNILGLKPDERAKLGIFLSFQYPHEIPGVPFGQMLRTAVGQRTPLRHPSRRRSRLGRAQTDGRAATEGSAGQAGTLPPVREFLKTLDEKLALLKMDASFAERNVNEGFSGGEKKRAEILQLAVLEPSLAILDETDSGLDVDALRTVAEGIQVIKAQRPDMSVLLITHYERFLDFLTPDRVLVMKEGRIVAEGGKDLADRIQREGYGQVGN